MIKGLNHVCFSVSDLEKSCRFWSEMMGAKLLVRGKSTAYFDLAGMWIALNMETEIPRKEIEFSYTHLAFSVSEEELDVFKDRFKNNGVNLLPGRERDPRDARSVYFTDPDGHKLELHTGTLQDRLDYYRNAKPHMLFTEDL
ncbi:metallothiol transferase FosB [Paenibacillus gansuensis]|uniref:Metallothiol transferase FosB n=1 Tax=Paenibacillus gansuensis TaxID=306542 RepID=A0ABW5PA12_9BACL